ncbi:RNA polymerase sigma factor (sigma-70 family) [Actinokineospora baliensis]|uniref:sigma factor-like helix-turn-helix DNA-binding protein n=1 Tax=Actinokineospora baliensis TaxID=547056 RepID=UPI00195D9240|nr:sigma factor-like helix-turn-helix DNA-binding protein [Actinokineospora baliensis]MBM7770880.1 RNA polymerase sigma factor (sigma-70 family) [Actinokineospora baliensis]
MSGNGVAVHAFADARETNALVAAVERGERAAETALYLRVAGELDRVAAGAVGSSAFDREDLHQEGAERLIRDARAGVIRNGDGGTVGTYIGRVIARHLLNVASTQRPGRPTDTGRMAQKLREALRNTADSDGEYDVMAAVTYAQQRFAWRLETFWAVHRSMFAPTETWESAAGDRHSLADTMSDPGGPDDLARVEIIATARALLESTHLSRREREVLGCLFGFSGPALSEVETGRVLGIAQSTVSKTKTKALQTLRALSGLTD